MCPIKIRLCLFVLILFFHCARDKAPMQPGIKQTGIPSSMPQYDIPWPSLANSPWPMYGHDPQHSCRSQYQGPQKGELEWNSKPFDWSVRSGIAIGVENTIYYLIYIYLMAINEDGSEKWRFACENRYATILIASDNTIYAPSYDNNFYAINSDGTLKWKIYLGTAAGSPTIGLDGILYTISPNQNTLYAIKEAGVIWSIKLGSGFQGECPAFSPDGATLYVAGVDSSLYALTTSGNVKWKRKLDGRFWNGPMIDAQGNIYCAPRSTILKLQSFDPNGNIRWEYQYGYMGHETQCLTMDRNGNIYFGADGRIVALDYAGHLRWEAPYPAQMIFNSAGLACDIEGTVYYGTAIKQFGVVAILSTGLLKWAAEINLELLGAPDYNTPVIGRNQRLYRNTVPGKGVFCIK